MSIQWEVESARREKAKQEAFENGLGLLTPRACEWLFAKSPEAVRHARRKAPESVAFTLTVWGRRVNMIRLRWAMSLPTWHADPDRLAALRRNGHCMSVRGAGYLIMHKEPIIQVVGGVLDYSQEADEGDYGPVQSCDWQPREAIVLIYQQTETNVGHDIYVCIQCFREEYPGQESCSPYRQSSPYVLSQQHGSRRVIPGSVCESLRNLSLQLEQLREALRDSVARIEGSEGERRAEEYYQYDRHLTNSLVLISCLARNLFHTFPRLTKEFVVQMFDYEGTETGHMRVKDLLDLFVHNRYMRLHNEFITDLVSEKPPEGTVVAEEFMGHRFKVEDFLVQIRDSIESVTIKDLTTRLRGVVKSLNVDTPYQDILFLVQNTESFSDLLEATIPSGSYDFILNTLFPGSKIPDAVRAAAKGDEIKKVIKFSNPHVKIGNRVDEKKIKISAKGECAYLVSGRVVLKTTEERDEELDYEDFFSNVVQAFGQERLLNMARRLEAFRKTAGGTGISR